MKPTALRSDENTIKRCGAPSRPSGRGWAAKAFETLLRWLGYGSNHRILECIEPSEGVGWAPRLAVASAAALVGTAAASGLSLSGHAAAAIALFWASFAVIVVPTAARLAWPKTSRTERIWLLNILGLALYLTRILAHPTGFDGHDEYLHWSTTIDIVDNHRLFAINSLLPVSPSYPGLEIVASSLVQLTGLSVYLCALILVGILRIVLTSAIFLIFESVTTSAWVGGLAALVYMANANFYTFNITFSYETIALDFLLVGIFVAVLVARENSFKKWRIICVSAPIFFALAVSHHMTSAIGVVVLCCVAASALFRGDRKTALATAAIAGIAILSLTFWTAVSGSAADTYVGGILGRALYSFYRLLSGANVGRELFVSEDGAGQPFAYRFLAILSILMLCAGLVSGFFRSLGLPNGAVASPGEPFESARSGLFLGMRDNPWAIVLTISSFAFPLSVTMRLTSIGWELGNRMSAFVYLGVGLVVAAGVAMVIIGPRPSRVRAAVVGLCLALLITGGMFGELPLGLMAHRYQPAADGASIEPMGIATAQWTRDWLGEHQRFASDRTNRLLLATYGVQRLVTSEQDGAEPGQALFGEDLSSEDMDIFQVARPSFVLVDLRLQYGRPLFGFYFGSGEAPELHKSPPVGVDLEKFDKVPGVGRIYDNGYQVIYDIRNLLEAAPFNRLNKGASLSSAPGLISEAATVATLPPLNDYVAGTNTRSVGGDPALHQYAARGDSKVAFGRTFRRGGQVSFEAAMPGPPTSRDRSAPSGAQAPWLYSAARRAPWAYSGEGTGRRIGDRSVVNYDSGVLRYVPK